MRIAIGTRAPRGTGVLLLVAAMVASVGGCSSPGPASAPTSTTMASPTPSAPGTTASCRGTGSEPVEEIEYRSVDGVDPGLLSLDLHRPVRPAGCGPAPIVVYVHGGGFQVGDKGNDAARKVRLFTDEGWAMVSVNHRLSSDPSVRYPIHEEDVAAAIAWVRDHARSFGGDADRILLVGHSSGAFLVSILSTDRSFLAAAGVPMEALCGTVSLDTEYDVTAQVAQGGAQERLYRTAFGDDPTVWAAGSPIVHTESGALRPPFLIVTRGAERRVAQAQAFGRALRQGGTPASVIDASPLDHAEVNDAVGAPNEQVVTPAVLELLRSCRRDAAP